MTPSLNQTHTANRKEYWIENQERRLRLCNERWRLVKELHQHRFSISGFSDYCFTQERTRFITRVTFKEALSEYNIPYHLITSICNSFDVSGQGKLDWRAIVFMLHTIRHPDSEPSNDLDNVFKFYTGKGLIDIDVPCKNRIRLREVEKIFGFIIRPDRIDEVLDEFNSIWTSVVLKSQNETMRVSKEAIHTYYEKLTNDNLYVSYKMFKTVCETLASTSPPFEDNYYPPFLVKIRRSAWLMKHALETLSIKAMETAILRWKEIAFKRKCIQTQLSMILNKIQAQRLSRGFGKVKRHALNCIALVEIQRLWRGHHGRLRTFFEWKKHERIIQIQSLFRGIQGRSFCAALIKKRNQAASKIQRAYRGHLGRRLVLKRMLTRLDQQRLIARKKLELRQLYITTVCATKMQRKFREKMKMKRYEEMVERRRRELIVKQEMKERQLVTKQQNDIYQRQVLEHYEKKKREESQQKIIQERTRNQIYLLHKKQFIDHQTHQLGMETRRRVEQNQHLRYQRTEEWKRKIERGGESRRKYCHDCLKSPETKSERKFRRHVKTLIKKRVQDVLKRADKQFVKMELDEVYTIAEKEVIDLLVKYERQRITNEMNEGLCRLDKELNQLAQERENEVMKKKRVQANWILCAAARRWRARQELRKICMTVYEKNFDETYMAYYYRNKRTVRIQCSN